MKVDGNHNDIPDLSGKVVLCSVKPTFNGSYSSVYHGKLGEKLVCHIPLVILSFLSKFKQVAIKVLKEIHGAKSDTMRRVMPVFVDSLKSINTVL